MKMLPMVLRFLLLCILLFSTQVRAQLVQQPSPRGVLPWTCTITTGDPGAGSPTLAADNDTPHACANDRGAVVTITGVACVVDSTTGTPTIDVKYTNGAGSSILSSPPISCGTTWTSGALSGTPALNPYTTLTTCSAPCELYIDYAQSSVGAKFVAVKITGTHR